MKYKDYSADDLIKDEFFQQWVFSPSEESNRFWLDFLQNYPGHRERVEEARQFLSFFHIKDKDVFEARVSNLKLRINTTVDDPSPETPIREPQAAPMKKPVSRKKILKLTYLFMVFLIGVFAVIYPFISGSSEEPSAPVTEEKNQVVMTQRGRRNSQTLPDGTRVWLYAESRVEYPKNLDSLSTRTVSLAGEAFFQVSEDLQKPFVVQVGDVNIVGYAASFSVKSYEQDKSIEIVVLTGRVRLEPKDQPLNKTSLSPDQRAVYDLATRSLSVANNVNAAGLTAWRNGTLFFSEEPFAVIKPVLERWYDVTINVKDTTSLGCTFSGELANKTLRETLEMFVSSGDASFEINGSDVVLSGKLCSEP